MDKICRELEEEDENLIPYGYLSHVLNLLGDLIPAPIMKHIVEDQQVLQEPSCTISLAEGSTEIHSSSATK